MLVATAGGAESRERLFFSRAAYRLHAAVELHTSARYTYSTPQHPVAEPLPARRDFNRRLTRSTGRASAGGVIASSPARNVLPLRQRCTVCDNSCSDNNAEADSEMYARKLGGWLIHCQHMHWWPLQLPGGLLHVWPWHVESCKTSS